jgi:hypothetical protein
LSDRKKSGAATLDPYKIAVLYYFGELGYSKLPQIAADALEQGYDGRALRRLAGLINPVAADVPTEQIDSAFREMGVAAPLEKNATRLALAAESATTALRRDTSVFDAATHIRIYICSFDQVPEPLHQIVSLSEQAERGSRSDWKKLEAELMGAMSEFLRNYRQTSAESMSPHPASE